MEDIAIGDIIIKTAVTFIVFFGFVFFIIMSEASNFYSSRKKALSILLKSKDPKNLKIYIEYEYTKENSFSPVFSFAIGIKEKHRDEWIKEIKEFLENNFNEKFDVIGVIENRNGLFFGTIIVFNIRPLKNYKSVNRAKIHVSMLKQKLKPFVIQKYYNHTKFANSINSKIDKI